MKSICFYFQVHQPFRLKNYRFFDIGRSHEYFDDIQNSWICKRVAEKCYLPTNKLMLDLIKSNNGRFRISYSISGVALDQFERFTPEVIDSFKALAETGCVEFLAETYNHSLASLKSKKEFISQVNMQKQRIESLFGLTPKVFRNTELIYSDHIADMVAEMGFEAQLTEGAKHILGWRSPNFAYNTSNNNGLKLLLKNFQLSDDIAFRFSQHSWEGFPLTTEKYVDWLNKVDNPDCINLFMDYETFGEHQWKETGIFEFMRNLPSRVLSHSDFSFKTPSELASELVPVGNIHVPYPISWADEERDLTAWLGNDLQDDSFEQLYELESRVLSIDDEALLRDWRKLQTSDHFYYMCTKWFSDGDVHKYFNHYDSPYDAYINYMNVLSDFRLRLDSLEQNLKKKPKNESNVNEG
ncbi:MAG: Membrane-anchored protein predicted to be involved in regulation of amylopullulanase [Bacteroidetes bacterium]|nr:Membrane-anchored protein predicted to be involved in regulation of amylopullulanase [Bacteroidota bacterium]